MTDFETAIAALDLRLFEKIESQSSDDDKRSFLACQLAVRELRAKYNYLEIGSYLGGSIQPYLVDDRCSRIYSIDKRPKRQPDARGVDYHYQNNSTDRMLRNLEQVGPVDKIVAIDADTGDLDASKIESKIDLCFIDGEHTDSAVYRDFDFCLRVLANSGAIVFHDASVTYNGLDRCIEHLNKSGRNFRAYSLPNIVFVIEIGDFPVHRQPEILDRLTNNYGSYIYSLKANDLYRRFANKGPMRLYRSFMTRIKGLNKFE